MEHPPVTMVTHWCDFMFTTWRFVAVRQCSPIFLRANRKDVCACVCVRTCARVSVRVRAVWSLTVTSQPSVSWPSICCETWTMMKISCSSSSSERSSRLIRRPWWLWRRVDTEMIVSHVSHGSKAFGNKSRNLGEKLIYRQFVLEMATLGL